MKTRLPAGLLPVLLLVWTGSGVAAEPDFSGTWKQSGERCVPRRSGDVTLHIEEHDADLTVETTMVRSSGAPRHAVQHYSLDGKIAVTTGADGDEFHTSIVRQGPSLVFSVEEHEDGRILLSKETWTLIDNGAALQRDRENSGAKGEGAGRQTLVYVRQ